MATSYYMSSDFNPSSRINKFILPTRMDTINRRRAVYVNAKQKKKLIELITQHPELIECKVTQDFNYKDSHILWHKIAKECNAIPGAKKTWRQWRKTWQDIKSKTKKRQQTNGEMPTSAVMMLTTSDQEALALKNVSSTTNNYQDSTLDEDNTNSDREREDNNFEHDVASTASVSELESLPEQKVLTRSQFKEKKNKNRKKIKTKHTNSCFFNCDMLAVQEKRKLQIKEKYYKIRKNYLKQKLSVMKEQTKALKDIANYLLSNIVM